MKRPKDFKPAMLPNRKAVKELVKSPSLVNYANKTPSGLRVTMPSIVATPTKRRPK